MATNINFPIYGFINNVLALSEENWRRFFKPFITDSVQNGLATTAGANMTVYVSAGECRCGAVMGILDEMIAIDVSNGDSTYDRIDSVIVQYTYGEPSTLAIAIVQGVPSTNPVPSTLTKVYDTLWQMEIAQILVPSGATSSSELTITDKRVIYESIESIIDDNIESEERSWSSQKTHEEIVSLSNEVYDSLNTKAGAIIGTASGNIVSITDGGDNLPVKELVVGIEPVQDLHGYDSPWPAGSGKNLLYKTIENASIDPNGRIISDTSFNLFIAKVENGQTYTFSNGGVAVASSDTGYFTSDPVMGSVTYDGSRDLSVPATFTATYTGYIALRLATTRTNVQLELGSTATPFTPYENICPITGHTSATVARTGGNMFKFSQINQSKTANGVTCSYDKDTNIFTLTGTNTSASAYSILLQANPLTPPFKAGQKYVMTFTARDGKSLTDRIYFQITYVRKSGGEMHLVSTRLDTDSHIITVPADYDYIKNAFVGVFGAATTVDTAFSVQIELGSSATPYSAYQGTTVTIPLGQTVYGGTLDVGTGTMRMIHALVDMGTLTWSLTQDTETLQEFRTSGIASLVKPVASNVVPDAYCSIYEVNTRGYQANHGNTIGITTSGNVVVVLPPHTYTDATVFKTAVTGQTFVYELATPTVITGLTPAILNTLLGYNAIWADCGAVDVNYIADTKLFLESQQADAESYCDEQTTATREMITESIESAMTATKNYTAGQLIIANSTLLRATENIANGGTITIGTNAEEVDVESLIAEKTNTAVTAALQAEVTTNLELISSLARNQMSNYSAIAEIVKSGNASKVYKIGDQVMTTWNDGTTDLDLPWDIVAMRDVVNSDGNTVPGMILQAHWVLPGVQFDASEASYVASAIIPAGTYYIEIGQNWGSNCKANYKYEFTTTQDVPVDGQIVITRSGNNQYTWGAPDQNPSTWVVYTFASNASITPIEGPLSLTEYTNEQTPSSTSLGTLLPSTKYSLNGINNLQRAGYGYNRWSNSAMRQWLNSDAVAGSWWEPKNPFDRQPQQLSSMRGFMAGLGSDFLSVVKPIIVTTALNTISDSEIGTSETTIDTFFCASLEEEYCVPQLAGVEGAYWPYWKERLELDSPQGSGADNANVNHIRYLISNHSSALVVRLRSAHRGSALNTWLVTTPGYVYATNAATSIGSCPACVIC